MVTSRSTKYKTENIFQP
uniref:Uncharacterized protein n=1 Tax=Arundo donax TaxID=35708 RepID=A0A0A9B7S3_ARUDO